MPVVRFLVKALILSVICGCQPGSDSKARFDDSPYDGVKASNKQTAGQMREAIRIDRTERSR